MSASFTKAGDGDNVIGRERSVTGDLVLDNSYPTGGYAIAASLFGLRTLSGVRINAVKGTLANSAGLEYRWDSVNGKLLIFYPTGGTTAPAAVAAPKSASGASTASAVDATTPNIVAGLGKEVANATDLSTVTLTITATGN